MRRDVYKKHHLLRSAPRPTARKSLYTFIFISLALLTLSRINHDLIYSFRGRVIALAAPVFEIVSGPVRQLKGIWQNAEILIANTDELNRLRAENQKLQQWKWRAKVLEDRLAAYAKIIQAVERPPLGFSTGQVISEGRGPFLHSVLLNTGRKDGVRNGYPVVSADGLVGRVVQSGARAAHTLLVSDRNSRIPVEIGNNRMRAILTGDGDSTPRLTYLSKGSKIRVGDEVFTSGQGGLFPRGLRIGKVVISGQLYRVKLYANLGRLDYLSVLFFKTPGLDLVDDKPHPGSPSRPKRLEQPVASISSDKAGRSNNTTAAVPRVPERPK